MVIPDLAGFADLLRCPRCLNTASFEPAITGWVACSCCGQRFSCIHGVLDFVGGNSDSALDPETYDQQKRVSIDGSLRVFAHLKQAVNGAIGQHLGNVMEVGAGTGLLTAGMLIGNNFDRAVITDISPNMLALCRARVVDRLGGGAGRVLFATYAAGDPIFASGRFDLCVAHSVVHHIPDYRQFFDDVQKALKPGGVAVFVEPGAPYHDAMSRAMADSLCDLIATGADATARDVRAIAAWVADVRFRLLFPDDERILRLEDKHLFWPANLARLGRDVGFQEVTVKPNFIDANGALGAREYLRELGISEPFSNRLLEAYDRSAKLYFDDLDESDTSGMYVCILRS